MASVQDHDYIGLLVQYCTEVDLDDQLRIDSRQQIKLFQIATMPPRRKKKEQSPKPPPSPPAWRTSRAKKLLTADLLNEDNNVPLYPIDDEVQDYFDDESLLTNLEIYNSRPEFLLYKWENFQTNLSNLREKIIQDKDMADADQAAFNQYRQAHPRPTTNHRGEPFWDRSEAQRLLRMDMDEGKHRQMKPSQLRQTRPVFEEHGVIAFGKKICQEKRRRKYIAYLQSKRDEYNRQLGL